MAKKSVRGDTFMYISQLVHPTTGDVLVDIPALKAMLDSKIGHGLLRYAYIIHDSDEVTESDVKERDAIREQYISTLLSALKHDDVQTTVADGEILEACDRRYPRLELKQKKPRHIHLVIRLTNPRFLSEIVKWFAGVTDNSIYLFKKYGDVRGQSRRELNALRYLIHAAQPDKFRYSVEDVVASFDYSAEIAAISILAKEREKYDMTREDIFDFVNNIVINKKTRIDFVNEHTPAMYNRYKKDIDFAEEKRVMSLKPQMRCSGYIGSSNKDPGGLGKSALNRIFGIAIAVHKYGLDLDKWDGYDSFLTDNPYLYHSSSADLFAKYENQPILCGCDFKASNIKASFREGFSGLKDFFDPHPSRSVRHVKGSTVVPVCDYVIFDGDEDWRTFFTNICRTEGMSEEEAKKQVSQLARRWMWYVDVVKDSRFSLFLNKQYYDIGFSTDDVMVEYMQMQFDYTSILNCDLPSKEILKYIVDSIMPLVEVICSFHQTSIPFDLIEKPVVSVRSSKNHFRKLS